MFYFQQQHQRRPQLSVDDYVQLQLLLRQEQAQREQAALYKKQQEEQRRLEKALYNLKVMTELQRRREQEELAIEAYYTAKKRRQQQEEALLRHRRQQEEAYYNAILEQRKQQQIEQQNHLRALAFQQQQAIKSAEYANPCHALAAAVASTATAAAEQDVSDSESEADQEHEVAKQLESLVRLIFGQQDAEDNQKQEQEQEQDEPEINQQQQEQEQEQEQDEPEINQQQQEQEQETDTMEEQTISLDDFVNYISKKAQELDDIDNDNDAMEEDEQDLAASAIQHIDDHEEDESKDSAMQEDEMPALVNSTESLHHLVHDILTNTTNDESFSNFPEEDPVKIAKFEALSRIEQELDEIRQQHEDHILHVTLDFSPDGRSSSPDIISASTAENREFLGYEDQIVKILLKLDMIESDGDEHIRNERKTLVKRAEIMLDKLDEYKQKEWERVSCSGHSDNEESEEEYIAVL